MKGFGLSSFSSPSSCDRAAAPGCICIPRILRRILCFINVSSTCPFDIVLNKEEDKLLNKSMIGSSGTAPGVVAKLMGLESLPLSDSTDDSIQKPKVQRARGKLVIPIIYQEIEDDEYFIFSFESQRRKSGRKKKSRMRRRESYEVSKGDLLDGDVVCDENDLIQVKDRPNESSCPTKIRRKEAKMISFETEGDSENSSPNSVLEFVGFATDQQASNSSGNIPRLGNSRMRRTLSEEIEKCESDGNEKSLVLMTMMKNKKSDDGFGRYEKWDEIGMEVMKLSWAEDEKYMNQFKANITTHLESQILSHLLDELLTNFIHF